MSITILRCILLPVYFLFSSGDLRDLHSFPTRRSSDLAPVVPSAARRALGHERLVRGVLALRHADGGAHQAPPGADRKSTRLNSSHLGISYAVFCLKKKNK